MMKYLLFLCPLLPLLACNANKKNNVAHTYQDSVVANSQGGNTNITLPPPDPKASNTNFIKVIGWPEDKKPIAPAGFTVTKYADDLKNPRWIYVGPNGDVFVAEAGTRNSANRITIFRDTNKDGLAELRQIFIEDLNQPLGMLILNNSFYIANTDGLLQFPYKTGDMELTSKGKKILNLPAGGYNNHWTRNIIANATGSKIYVSVGSGSNVGEHGMENEIRRANILEINPDGSGEQIYASGLRNPVGMDWEPTTQTLWTAVNERDHLGDDLVPDYMTSVKKGAFYGWPYSYWGQNVDPRREGERDDLVKKAIKPDYALGSHTASLGLAFYNKTTFPQKYHQGVFVGQHGSWNRSELVGYKVVFIPFKNGKPTGKTEDFLTGFLADETNSKAYGRPVGLAVLPDGSLLVADDAGNAIWRVSVAK